MLLITLGLLIWIGAHLLRSCTPRLRQLLQDKFGNGAKGIIAVVILFSLLLMIAGYRGAEPVALWSPPFWLRYLNNFLMLLALFIYFTTATKPGTAFVFSNLANPQLTGFKIWAAAHLLVNGDLASVLLFGGLLAWAVIQMVVSKRSESLVDRNAAPISSPWIHLIMVVGIFAAISLAHHWLGAYPLAR